MLTKEKLVSLKRYLDDLINKLNSPVSKKHEEHSKTYKDFLLREIKMVQNKLEEDKLVGNVK